MSQAGIVAYLIFPGTQKALRRWTEGFLKECGGDLLSPESYGPSTIGAEKLNYCVRDGNRCGLLANTTTNRGLDSQSRCDFGWKTTQDACQKNLLWRGGCELKAARAISITRLNSLQSLHL